MSKMITKIQFVRVRFWTAKSAFLELNKSAFLELNKSAFSKKSALESAFLVLNKCSPTEMAKFSAF